ncbi:hypothetical protein [Burkholderia vietnamiensis]|uniref:hypothetical protein n=1 Tax=Burkholderia vietnamiensis TaxID=60552 RepID=UPI0015884EBF|nr:hypothetical protein [Burkholderia vietnamiensis]
MSEDTSKELQDHILECSQNYGDLKNEVALQNAKIDSLAERVHELYSFAKGAVYSALLGSATVIGYFLQHIFLK